MAVRQVIPTEQPIPEIYLQIVNKCFTDVDPVRTTNAAFQQQLELSLRTQSTDSLHLPAPLIAAPNDQLLLSNPALTELLREIRAVEQAPIREIAQFLQAMVDKREARGDLWPDGRLQLGIAYAALEEYTRAREVLEAVIRICESGGKFNQEQALAA